MKCLLRGCLLFFASWLMVGQVSAQVGYLHVFVTDDTSKSAVSGLSITCINCRSTEFVQQGRATIALPTNTRPDDTVRLRLVKRSPQSPEWFFISPPDGLVTVPYDSRAANAVPIVVARKRDSRLLKDDKVVKGIVEKTLKAVTPMLNEQVSTHEFDQALEMQAKAFGVTREQIIQAISEWKMRVKDPYQQGLAALFDRKYAEATSLLTESYEMRKKAVAEFADAAFYLGQSLYGLGKYREAVEKFQEVYSIRKDDANVLSWFGNSLLEAGRYAEAEPLYKRALDIREKALGKDHPSTATSLNNLAALYKAQGKYAEAEPLYKRALDITEKALGKDHPTVATILENYAVLLRKMSREDEANELAARAQQIREKSKSKGDK